MNPVVQLTRQLQYLFIALLFASFAVAQSVQAEPNEDDLIGSVAQEANAVPDVGSATGNAGTQQPTKLKDNTWQIPTRGFPSRPGGQCNGNEAVNIAGKLQISFVPGTHEGNKAVLPETVKTGGAEFLPKGAFKAVGGTGRSSGFHYDVSKVKVVVNEAKAGRGELELRIFFVAKENRLFQFKVVLNRVAYGWNNKNDVTSVIYSRSRNDLFATCP
jgi:hypothetical protein